MPKSGLNVALKGLDDIFSTEESRQEEQREQVQQIPVSELFPFKNHPFKVLDDDSMTRTVESISQFGVLAPLIARPRPEGGYEIISGHRRQHAAELAGLETLPVIVREMSDDAAVILMVDSNLQREHILPSERAFAYKMKLEAIKKQGARSDLTSARIGPKLTAAEKVAEEANDTKSQVKRFIRLTCLVPELLDMVDTLRIRYTCYGKLRKQTNCTGQTGYTVHILDEIIDKAVRQIFSKMRGIPKEQIVTKRYEKENAERKNHLQDLQTQRNKAEKDLLALKTEVLACIKGESVLPRETLAEMITAQEEKLTELENLCEAASEELEKTAELMDKVSRLYDELISYADLYDSANFEAKKMIVNQLIRRVDVYRGYQINISFNFDLTPYIEGE